MTRGTLFLIVGASGSGKDTLISEARKQRPDLHFVQRVITRPAKPDDEAHIPIDTDAFAEAKRANEFCLSWDAHGNRYGISRDLEDRLASGQSAVLNGSRSVVDEARRTLQPVRIIRVTARLDELSRRLRDRGREDEDAIERRIARATRDAPSGPDVTVVDNSGSLAEGTVRFLAALV